MSEIVIISSDNIAPLQDFISGISPNIQAAITNFKIEVVSLLENKDTEIDFNHIQRRVNEIFDTVPTRFVNSGVENSEGSNEGSLRIFAIALLFKLTDDDTLPLFGKHWADVQKTPEGNDHQNIRQLNEYGLNGVKIHGIPFKEKVS